jgi:hypothetical protein
VNFLAPLIAPKKEEARPEHEVDAVINIYRTVINRLTDGAKPSQKTATEEVLKHYYARIGTLKANNQLVDTADSELRKRIIEWEREHIQELISEGRVSALASFLYLGQLGRTLAHLQHHSHSIRRLPQISELTGVIDPDIPIAIWSMTIACNAAAFISAYS